MKNAKESQVTGMQQVYNAMELFAYNSTLITTCSISGSSEANGNIMGPSLPTYRDLGNIPDTLSEIKEMSGKQRRDLLTRAGVTGIGHTMVYMRAIQHLCTVVAIENVNYSEGSLNEGLLSQGSASRSHQRHYTACVSSDSISSSMTLPLLHPYRSIHYWSPVTPYKSLLCDPVVVSSSNPDLGVGGQLVPSPVLGDSLVSSTNNKRPKGPSRYAGIHNQGSTCYLNSILQCLFHLGSFCRAIYSIPTQDEVDGTKSMPLALQRLFYAMGTQEGSTLSTKELTQSFGWSSAETFIQHDIHELTRKLIDNLEEKINAAALVAQESSILHGPRNTDNDITHNMRSPAMGTQQELKKRNAMRKLFVGQLENYIEVDDIKYKSATMQDFYDLQLVVKGKKSIYESLEKILEPTLLTGKDKYLLEGPDGIKSYHDARMGTRFRFFPPVLLMHLTRFEYDVEKDDIAKVLTRYEYYDSLDLHRFTPGVQREKCIYNLHSVLVHSGSNVGYGHYFCFVKRSRLRKVKPLPNDRSNDSVEYYEEEEWIKFNDSEVSRASRSDVFGANFGGFTLDHWGTKVFKTTSAYMLCYVQTYPAKDDFSGPFSVLLPPGSVERSDLHSSKSPLNCLLAPLSDCEIPQHLKDRFEAEKEERLRKIIEEREEHLYTKVHFITHSDMEGHEELFSVKFPRNLKFPSSRTLRATNTSRALDVFGPFVEKLYSISARKQHLWCVGASNHSYINDHRFSHQCSNETQFANQQIGIRSDTHDGRCSQSSPKMRLGRRITNRDTVESLAEGDKEICVFVSSLLETAGLEAPASDLEYELPGEDGISNSVSSQYVLTHHSVYNPDTLKIEYIGSLVVDISLESDSIQQLSKNAHSYSSEALEKAKTPTDISLEELFGETTANNSRTNLLMENGTPEAHVFEKISSVSSTSTKNDCGTMLVGSLLSFLSCDSDTILPDIVWLDEQDPSIGYTKATDCHLISGGRYIWQRKSTSAFLKLYPNVESYHKLFNKEKFCFTLKKVSPPYTTVAHISLPLAMPYEYIQRYVYNVLKDKYHDISPFSCLSSSNNASEGCKRNNNNTCINSNEVSDENEWDLIRFSHHNSSTKGPFFKKIKKKEGADLNKLLSTHEGLQPYLYFEVGKYTVSELEASNPLSFDFFNSNVQIVSTHTILLPPPDSFTMNELLVACATEVGLPAEKASSLQLVDIWQGKIYTIHLPSDQKLSTPFVESAEYRLEPIPEMNSDLSEDEQLLVPVQHFHYFDNKVVVHGDPFCIWIGTNDLRVQVYKRIAQKLGVSEPSIAEWRPRFVQGNRVVPLETDITFAEQLAAFLSQRWTDNSAWYGGKPTIKPSPYGHKSTVTFGFYYTDDANAMPFFGMEHAPLPKRRGGPARNIENDLTIKD